MKGNVVVETNDEKNLSLKAIKGRKINNGYIIVVKDASYCDIYSNDQRTFLRLDSNTKIKIIENQNTREIYLLDGSFYISNRNPEISKETFIFSNYSQIYLTNSNVWVSSKNLFFDQIYSFGSRLDISDKYKGIRYSTDDIAMIHASESKIEQIPQYENEIDIIVPDYIFSDFIINREKFILADSILYDLNEFQLIPDFTKDFNTEEDTSKFGINIITGTSIIYDNFYFPFGVEGYFNDDNFNAKIKLDYFLSNRPSDLKINDLNDISTILSVFENINYQNKSKIMSFSIGDIENITFGHGQLLNKYSNTYNYPIMKRTGLLFNLLPKNKYSYKFDFFISDLSQIFNSGGMFGYHISYHISKHFPLTLGYGSITDFNQYSELDLDAKSTIKARQLDFEYELLKNKNYKINLIAELDGIFFNNEIQYFRYDNNDESNNSSGSSGKSRKGTWGSMLGTRFESLDGHKFKIGIHANAALYLPSFFSSTYDFEKTLIGNYDSSNRFFLLNDNSGIFPCQDVDDDGDCNNNDVVYLSKEMQTLFLKDDFVYPTVGASLSYDYNYYNKRGLKMSGMYLVDNDRQSSESYYSFDIEMYSKYGYIFKRLDDFSIYLHRNFAISNSNYFKENIIYGLKANIKIN
ncbi:MAG: hypothetical protein CMG01_04485, partial [Candidatus Marinimicrobia bacterium]|nr:hypothetical protein [Candidatus Neomarinimicrobiota bacterium]